MFFSLKTKRKLINNNQPFAEMAKGWAVIVLVVILILV